MQSAFAFCPEGDRHLDIFRLYESLQAGSIPVLVDQRFDGLEASVSGVFQLAEVVLLGSAIVGSAGAAGCYPGFGAALVADELHRTHPGHAPHFDPICCRKA